MALVAYTGKHTTADRLHLAVGERRRPARGRRVFPVSIRNTEHAPQRHAQRRQRKVRPRVGRQAYDCHGSARPGQSCEASQRRGRIHVVERRHRDDGVEGLRLERDVEHVTSHPLDRLALVSRPCPVENRLIDVESDDVRNARVSEFRRKNAVATADVEDPRGIRRERSKDQRMVVGVRVPHYFSGSIANDAAMVSVIIEGCWLERRERPSNRCS